MENNIFEETLGRAPEAPEPAGAAGPVSPEGPPPAAESQPQAVESQPQAAEPQPQAAEPQPQAAPGGWTPPPPGSVPPGGSYPPPGQPYYPPPPRPEKKVRRVGTITMALCLIAAGVLLVVRVLAPNALDFWLVARLSPVVLVLLGVEMLVASARHKNEKLRFDILSVFISLLLIGGSLVAIVVPEYIQREVEGNRVGNRLSAELEAGTADLLERHPELPVYNVEWYVNVEGTRYTDEMGPMDLRAEHYVQARVFMPGGYKDAGSFAKDCRAVLDLLQSQVPHMNYASLYSTINGNAEYEGDVTFSLWLENRYQMDSDVARLADMAETNYWQGEFYDTAPPQEDPFDGPDEDGPDDPDDWDTSDGPAPEGDTAAALAA